ncbi:MAG: glycosyltransferase [Chitinophagales bacterium]
MSKHIVFSVVNDLNYDQRMRKICTSLHQAGFEITLIGREMEHSKPLMSKPYHQIRWRMWFTRGKLFYLTYNLRLLWHFFWNKYDIQGGIDLDTLLAHYLAAKIKGRPHTYDAHEYFTELPEVVHRPVTKFIWKAIEKWIVPRTQYAYTINQTYAELFRKEYGTHFEIVRNAAVFEESKSLKQAEVPYILYQGAVNVGRGVEEMIQAMPMIPNHHLYICGKGDQFETCQSLVEEMGLQERVRFFGFVEPEALRQITLNAKLGFTFFTKDGESYYYSLANRFFDYFHAGVPQLCVNFPEYRHINEQVEIAVLLENLSPKMIAQAANDLLNNQAKYQRLRQNCLTARKTINWQNEEKKLVALYKKIVSPSAD